MSKEENNILDFIVSIISDFAARFRISIPQAYRYLDNNKGIDFLLRNYDVEHTFSFDDVVQDVTDFCHNRRGSLV